VRSLVLDEQAHHNGVDTMLLEEMRQSARREGFDRLCALPQLSGCFVQKEFPTVSHPRPSATEPAADYDSAIIDRAPVMFGRQA
jgi:hypothetical protein